MQLISSLKEATFWPRLYPIQDYIPALNRLTRLAIDASTNEDRARGLAKFVSDTVLKREITLPREIIEVLYEEDLTHMGTVIKHAKEIQGHQFVITPLQILLDEIEKIWPDVITS